MRLAVDKQIEDQEFPITARSCVLTAPGQIMLQDFTIPHPEPDSGVLQVEVCGVCGADVEIFNGHGPAHFDPVALGHEVVGRILAIGDRAAARWGVAVGDRVVVNEVISCGNCRLCASGHGEMCNGFFGTQGSRYGFIPITTPPGAWGGFGTHMQLHRNTRLCRIADHVPTAVAAMFMPIANGVHWLFDLAGLRPRASVLVIGPGPQGLAVTAVGVAAAGLRMIVAGRHSDTHRLELAAQLGSVRTVDTENEDVVEVVTEVTSGLGADAVVITTSGADDVLSVATRCVRMGGTIVLAGTNGWKSEQRFKGDALVFRNITLKGAPGHSLGSIDDAARLLEAESEHFAPLAGDEYPLTRLENALSDPLASQGGVHRSVVPNLAETGPAVPE
ncbi:zinc-dependent alcohol dehydrogenase [Nocardia sp. NPDC004278]